MMRLATKRLAVKRFAIPLLAAAVAAIYAAPSAAGDAKAKQHHPTDASERYVRAGNIVDLIFGGPRYYDNRTITTAAGACGYHRVSADADAINVVNDHYCGK